MRSSSCQEENSRVPWLCRGIDYYNSWGVYFVLDQLTHFLVSGFYPFLSLVVNSPKIFQITKLLLCKTLIVGFFIIIFIFLR
jgi:hypothetical protein